MKIVYICDNCLSPMRALLVLAYFIEICMISLDKADLSEKIAELVALRKSISLDLKVIAENTKIPTQMLKNIELKNFNKLPPEPIGRSFIKQYTSIIEKEFKKSQVI